MNVFKPRYKSAESKCEDRYDLFADERARLLTDPEPNHVSGYQNTRGRAQGISLGAAEVLSSWPDHLTRAICFITALSLLSISFCLLLLLALERVSERNEPLRPRAMCKPMIDGNGPLFGFNSISAAIEEKKRSVTPNNVFYITNEPLNRSTACGLESVLKLVPDKLVFIITITDENANINETKDKEQKYITSLKASYGNLIPLEMTFQQYFHGSMFEKYAGNNVSLFAAKILTVWQFGGIALLPNVMMNKKDILERRNGVCEISEDIYYCPEQCTSFGYTLIQNTLHTMADSFKNPQITDIINISIDKFCKNNESHNNTGCNGIKRMEKNIVCENIENLKDSCEFIRLNTTSLDNKHLNDSKIKRFCPNVFETKMYVQNNTESTMIIEDKKQKSNMGKPEIKDDKDQHLKKQ